MELSAQDLQALNALKAYASSPELLDRKHADCKCCKADAAHVPTRSKTAFFWTLGLGGMVFWMACVALSDRHAPSFEAFLLTLGMETVAGLLAWSKVESRARRQAHAVLNERKNEALGISRALVAMITEAQEKTCGENGILAQLTDDPFDKFLQRAMHEQYVKRVIGTDSDGLSELLSAVSHGREMLNELDIYRAQAKSFLDSSLDQTNGLLLSVQDHAGHNADADPEFMVKSAAIYRKVRTWRDSVCVVPFDDMTQEDIRWALANNFDHASALAGMEKLLGALPSIPSSAG